MSGEFIAAAFSFVLCKDPVSAYFFVCKFYADLLQTLSRKTCLPAGREALENSLFWKGVRHPVSLTMMPTTNP